jgi:hypothetical protein
MTDPTTTLALCKWLRDKIREWESQAKSQLELVEGERKAARVNGMTVAYVTQAHGRRTVDFDDQWLLDWVRYHFPTEVETVEQVRPAFRKKLADQAARWGAIRDSEGVMYDDGVNVNQGDSYPMVKPTEEADIVIAGLLAKGAIGVNGLKALPPEPESRWQQDTEAGAIG